MQFSSIASGSSGNCLYAGNDNTHILIDAGISKKRIEEGLKHFQVEPKDISAILVTHEHADHIQGIGVWSRKYHIPVYATRGTIREMLRYKSLGAVDPSIFHEIRPQDDFMIGDIQVHPFSMSHDAADPVSYRVSDAHHSIGTVTDLGYYDQGILEAMRGCDLLYVEANHDIRMLETGPYPYALKRRIAGNYGHLCNEAAGQLIGTSYHQELQRVILGHLSKDNNYPDLARQAVYLELMRDYDISEKKLSVAVAPRDHAADLIKL